MRKWQDYRRAWKRGSDRAEATLERTEDGHYQAQAWREVDAGYEHAMGAWADTLKGAVDNLSKLGPGRWLWPDGVALMAGLYAHARKYGEEK